MQALLSNPINWLIVLGLAFLSAIQARGFKWALVGTLKVAGTILGLSLLGAAALFLINLGPVGWAALVVLAFVNLNVGLNEIYKRITHTI